MHIPDGFLSASVATTTAALSIGALGLALRQTRRTLPARKVPLMGLAAAFVFAAQMLNFPVAGGTSGHLIGGVLCSALLGPSPAIIVLSSVLIVQCFVFADGGVLALGANIFNMAVICSAGGYFIHRAVHKLLPHPRGRLVAIAFASWLATLLAAVTCAGELAASGTVKWSVAFPAMSAVHMLIGLGEAAITTLVIFSIQQTRPDLLNEHPTATPRAGYVEFITIGLFIALGLALFVTPFACPWPDGLDRVADALGFKGREIAAIVHAPISNYVFPGISSTAMATSIAGALGTIIAFALALLFARALIPAQAQPAKVVDAGAPHA